MEGYQLTNKGKIANNQDSLLLALLVSQTAHEVLQKKEEVTASNDYKALPSIKIDAGRLNWKQILFLKFYIQNIYIKPKRKRKKKNQTI